MRCIDLCSKRACCFASGPGGCYETDTAWCEEFSSCSIVNDYEGSALALNDFGETIDDDEAAAGDDTGDGNVEIDIAKEVNDICAYKNLESPVALDACKDVCNPHKCCWNQDEECYDPITVKTSEECKMFVGCDNLRLFMEKQEQNAPDALCVKEAVASDVGKDVCQTLCHKRGCCWVKESSGNCYEEYTTWCDEYKQCLILDSPLVKGGENNEGTSTSTGDDGTQSPEDSASNSANDGPHPNELCTPENVASSRGHIDCQNKCDERACCWLGDCMKRKPEWCEEYKACLILDDKQTTSNGDGGEQTLAENTESKPTEGGTADRDDEPHPNELCTADKIADANGKIICQNRCDERACCWIGDCMKRKPEWCEEYKACLILDQQGSSSEMIGSESPPSTLPPTPAPTVLPTPAPTAPPTLKPTSKPTPSPTLVPTPAPVPSPTQGESSQQSSQNDALKEGSDMEPVTLDSELEKICSDEGIKEDNGESCQRLCKPQSCCFATDEMFSCKEEQPVLCNEFKACGILFKEEKSDTQKNNAEPVTLKTELTKMCSDAGIAEDGGEACKRLCKPQSCCFADEEIFSCREDQKDVCDEFDPCKSIFKSKTAVAETDQKDAAVSTSNPGIPPKPEVDDACNKNYITDEEKCHMLCADAGCCFTDDAASSCQGMKTFCGEYAPCQRVFDAT